MNNKILTFVFSAITVMTSCYAGQLRPCEAYVLEIASDGARITLPNPSAKGKTCHRWVGTFIPVAGTTDHPHEGEGLTYASEPPRVQF